MSSQLSSSLLYEKHFRWRAGEITRLEGFSDAVFAFAVTLLVVSLEVPKTFAELQLVMKGFVAFGICFASLALVWKEHTIFFRRYGLQTPYVVFLNCVLLFLILFFVYPLKFLFSFLVGEFTGGRLAISHLDEPVLLESQVPQLMSMYGLGLAAVYFIFVLLYLYAYRRRSELELNEVEIFITKHALLDHLAILSIALLSTSLALTLPLKISGLSGMFYWLIPIYFTVGGKVMGRKQRKLLEASERQSKVAAG
jgi:uncharacterized membrane protein